MTPLSYHSSNLSLIALEAMRLLVQNIIKNENERYFWKMLHIHRIPSILLFWIFLILGIKYTHELTFFKASLENMNMAMRYAQKSIFARLPNVRKNWPYVTLSYLKMSIKSRRISCMRKQAKNNRKLITIWVNIHVSLVLAKIYQKSFVTKPLFASVLSL